MIRCRLKNRRTAEEFLERPPVVTKGMVAGTKNWCRLHNTPLPDWIGEDLVSLAPMGRVQQMSEERGRNGYTALVTRCNVVLAVAYGDEGFWQKAAEAASHLGEDRLVQLIAERSPLAYDEAERVCRELNDGYRAAIEGREAYNAAIRAQYGIPEKQPEKA